MIVDWSTHFLNIFLKMSQNFKSKIRFLLGGIIVTPPRPQRVKVNTFRQTKFSRLSQGRHNEGRHNFLSYPM